MSTENLSDMTGEVLRDAPIDFFSTVKDAPEHLAAVCYEELTRRRQQIKTSMEEAQACLKALKWTDQSDEETRWEMMTELMDKVNQMEEILEYHQGRRIPTFHRVVLEAQILAETAASLALIVTSCAKTDELKDDKLGHDRFVMEFRERIRYTDRVYYDVHMNLLKSFLGMPW